MRPGPRRARLCLACFCLLAFSTVGVFPQAAEQAAKPLTVERIYSQPSLSGRQTTGIAWSPDGRLLSYFERRGQGREARTELWAVEVATGARRVLVEAEKLQAVLAAPSAQPSTSGQQTGLGRITPQRYLWAPKSNALLLISQGQLHWFDLKTQSGKKLTSAPLAEGGGPGGEASAISDPKISPDGQWVSFVRGYDLHVVNVETGRERQVTTGGREELMNGRLDWVYPEELDIRTAYWWSPDSKQMAFLQMDERPVGKYPLVDYLSYTGKTEWMRYPKAGGANPKVRVGVVGVTGGQVKWMDTGKEADVYIARVNWLQDSRRLAIQRLNRAQNKLDLLFADTATGRSQTALTEEDKLWINLSDDLHFFADGQKFLWSSERDGFRHLYLYEIGGKLQRQITSEAWAVTDVVGIDEKQDLVYFTATEKSPIERHLYRIGLDGSGMKRLTREDGTHSPNFSPDWQRYVDSYSNVMTPTRQDIYRADGTHQLVLNENKVEELASYRLRVPEFFTVAGADGTTLHAMMLKPQGFDSTKKYPVIVYLYGGPHGQVVRNVWGGANFLWHQMMAQKGYIIFSVDNRGTAARGHAFETPIHRRMGEVELADQLAAVDYLKSQPFVDGARIGIWGWSYGGYMTCYAMLQAGDVFKAGFAGAPVTDWRQYDTIYTERYMGLPKENEAGYKQSSPATHAAKLKGKLLIAHGTGDDNVHAANTVELIEEFIKAKKYVEVQIYPGRGHGVSDPTARIHLFNRVTQFFLDSL